MFPGSEKKQMTSPEEAEMLFYLNKTISVVAGGAFYSVKQVARPFGTMS